MSNFNFRTLLSWWFRSPYLKMLVKVELPQKYAANSTQHFKLKPLRFGVFRANKKRIKNNLHNLHNLHLQHIRHDSWNFKETSPQVYFPVFGNFKLSHPISPLSYWCFNQQGFPPFFHDVFHPSIFGSSLSTADAPLAALSPGIQNSSRKGTKGIC